LESNALVLNGEKMLNNSFIRMFLFFSLFLFTCSRASSINLYPETVKLYTNITIEANITGNPGDYWELLVITPENENETLANGTLGASGNFIGNFSYNSTLRGTYHVSILLNSTVNTSSSWCVYETNSTQTQGSFAVAFSLNYSVPFTVNASQNQSSFTTMISLNLSIPFTVNASQSEDSFTTTAVGGLKIYADLSEYFVTAFQKISIKGKAVLFFPNGTVIACSNIPIYFYLDNTTQLLYNSTSNLLEPGAGVQTYTDANGEFYYIFEAPFEEGIHELKVNATCYGYYGEKISKFVVVLLHIKLYSRSNFTKTEKDEEWWALGETKNNTIYGLIREGEKPGIYANASKQWISLNFSWKERAYLVFTRNDWERVKKRVKMFLSRELFKYPKENFGYSLGKFFTVILRLEYRNLLFLGNYILSAGEYAIRIEKSKLVNGKQTIKIVITG